MVMCSFDQLAQVLVAAGDDHLHALGRGHVGQRGDHVVGFHAGHRQHFPAQQVHHLVDGLDLGAQVIGHGRARGLVLVVHGIAEGGARRIEHAHRVVRHHVFAQRLHHVDHAANGTRGRAGRVAGHGTQVGHGMVGAVQVAGAVYQHQGLGFAHSGRLCLPRGTAGMGMVLPLHTLTTCAQAQHRSHIACALQQKYNGDMRAATLLLTSLPALSTCAGPGQGRKFAQPQCPGT